jgi:hypothetical protein
MNKQKVSKWDKLWSVFYPFKNTKFSKVRLNWFRDVKAEGEKLQEDNKKLEAIREDFKPIWDDKQKIWLLECFAGKRIKEILK